MLQSLVVLFFWICKRLLFRSSEFVDVSSSSLSLPWPTWCIVMIPTWFLTIDDEVIMIDWIVLYLLLVERLSFDFSPLKIYILKMSSLILLSRWYCLNGAVDSQFNYLCSFYWSTFHPSTHRSFPSSLLWPFFIQILFCVLELLCCCVCLFRTVFDFHDQFLIFLSLHFFVFFYDSDSTCSGTFFFVSSILASSDESWCNQLRCDYR